MARPYVRTTRRYEEDLRLFRGGWAKAGLALGLGLFLLLPQFITDDFWLSVLNYAGIVMVGAIGLTTLHRLHREVSLGHAFFIGAGAYSAAQVGGELDLPLPVWLRERDAGRRADGRGDRPFLRCVCAATTW